MKNWLFILVAASLTLGSCRFVKGKRVSGNGNIQTEARTVTGFTGVHSGGNFEVLVGIGPESVKIEAEDNLLPYIETYVQDGALRIETKDGFWLKTSRDIKIYVTAPRLHRFSVTGSGDMTGTTPIADSTDIDINVTGNADVTMEVDAPQVSTSITGNGDIRLKGATRDFDSHATGNGHLKAFDLQTENAKIEILGNGSAEIFASIGIDLSIGGNGSIRYKGGAQIKSQHVTGNGSISKVD